MWLFRLFPWWLMLVIAVAFAKTAWQEYDKARYSYPGLAPSFVSIDTFPGTENLIKNQELAILARLTKTFIFETGDKITNRLTLLPLMDSNGAVRLILQSRVQHEQAFKTYLKQHMNADGWIEIRAWLRETKETSGAAEATQKLMDEGFDVGATVLFVEPFWQGRETAYQDQTKRYMQTASLTGTLAALAGLMAIWKFIARRKRVRPQRLARAIPQKPVQKTTRTFVENPEPKIAPKPAALTASSIPSTRRSDPVVGRPKSKHRKRTPEEVVAKAFGKSVRRPNKRP